MSLLKRCPGCGQEVPGAVVRCPSCGHDFGKPAAAPTGGLSKGTITVIVVGVLAITAAILAGVVLPPMLKAMKEAKLEACKNNLTQLSRIERAYRLKTGAARKERGGAFWTSFTTTKPPLIDHFDLLVCPLRGSAPAADKTDFRGPTGLVHAYADRDAIGADKEGNHGWGAGGNIVLKNGEVIAAAEVDPIWGEAGRTTGP